MPREVRQSGLNVFVGGEGAGKSTLIESVRYVLTLPSWPSAFSVRNIFW
jgi:DNA repair exonuclease SbcCD ATPase subunit